MQQLPVPPSRSMRRKLLLGFFGLLSGLCLYVIGYALFFQLDITRWVLCILLLYLLIPLLPSMYIAQQRGDAREGYQTGLLTSITALVLALLAAGNYLQTQTHPQPRPSIISPAGIFVYVVFLNSIGLLVSVIGTIIGSKLGEAWRKRTFLSSSGPHKD